MVDQTEGEGEAVYGCGNCGDCDECCDCGNCGVCDECTENERMRLYVNGMNEFKSILEEKLQMSDGRSQSEKVREILDTRPHLQLKMLIHFIFRPDFDLEFDLVRMIAEGDVDDHFRMQLWFKSVKDSNFANANYLFGIVEPNLSEEVIMDEMKEIAWSGMSDDWYCKEDKLGQLVQYYLNKIVHFRAVQSKELTDAERENIIKMFFPDGNIPAPIPEEERKELKETYTNMTRAERTDFNSKQSHAKLDSMFANNIDTDSIMDVIWYCFNVIRIEEFLDRILARNNIRTCDVLILVEKLIYSSKFVEATTVITAKRLTNNQLDMIKEELIESILYGNGDDDGDGDDDSNIDVVNVPANLRINEANVSTDPRIVFINSKYT